MGEAEWKTVQENEEIYCSICGEPIEEEEEYIVIEDDILCESCFDSNYAECEECGEITLEDDLQFWGDMRICPTCMEEHIPTFIPEENAAETEDAYQAMFEKYMGKKTIFSEEGEHALNYSEDGDLIITYRASVTVDKDGRIIDISRLTAQVMTSESERRSQWRDYPIDESDYESIMEDMLEEYLDDD